MRIVTYNLFKGGKPDYSAWQQILDTHQPELFLAQESSAPQQYLAHLSAEQQARYAGGMAWQAVGTNYWGSAVCVRDGTVTPIAGIAALGGWVTGVTVTGSSWQAPGRSLQVISLHTPTVKGRTYLKELGRILDVLAAVRDPHADLVLGGDFNVTVGRRQAGEPLANRPGELALLDRLEREFGLISCWQTAHPGEPLPQTLRWLFKDDSLPYHCDGIFVPASWQGHLQSCDVVRTWAGGSDHYPVVATFAPDDDRPQAAGC